MVYITHHYVVLD